MMPDTRTPIERFRALTAGGLDRQGRLWLISPQGLLAACRQAVLEADLAFLDVVAASGLLDRLDDESIHTAAPAPSDRAKALVAVARVALWCRGFPTAVAGPPVEWIERAVNGFRATGSPAWAAPAATTQEGLGGDRGEDSSRDPMSRAEALVWALHDTSPHPALLSLGDLLRHLLSEEPVEAPASAVVAILTSRGTGGELVSLEVSLAAGPPGMALDAVRAPFTRVQDDFEAATLAAWRANGSSVSGRWAPFSERTGAPLDVIVGESVGAGAAFALYSLLHPGEIPSWVAGRVAFTGGIDDTGALTSLLTPDRAGLDRERGLTAYENKLKAADGRTVVVPAVDHPAVADLVESGRVSARLLPAPDLAAAVRGARRLAEAEARFEHTHAAAAPAPRRRRTRLYGALATLALAVLVITILARQPQMPANASAGYSFQPETHLTGVTIDRNWDFSGGALVARITATNTATVTVTDTYEEVIPKSLATSPDDVGFTPAPDQIVSRDPVVVRYDLSLGPNATLGFSYKVVLGQLDGPQKRLSVWGADAQRAKADWDSRGRDANPGPVIALGLPAAPLLVGVGQSVALQVTGTLTGGAPAPASLLQGAAWTSSNSGVAEVVGGTLTGLSPGQVVIGVQEGGKSATQLVIVAAPPATSSPLQPPPLTASTAPRNRSSAPAPIQPQAPPASAPVPTAPAPAPTAPAPVLAAPNPTPPAQTPAPVQVPQSQPPPPPAYRYHVYGTCPAGGCGVFMRTGPGYSQYQSTGLIHEHDAVDIVCQTRGETVSQSGWGTSSIWDKLTNGSWVTDLYVDTPNVNQFSPPIPQC